MLSNVRHFIEQQRLIQSGSTLVVGLSGGPDSVCLLHILHTLKDQYNLSLIAVHIDHEWRADSDEDALFCKQLAESLQIPFILKKASESSIKNSTGSKEDLGRRIRRSFFEEIAKELQADSVFLAHHANDQQETFLLRIMRGASIAGLASMRPQQGIYRRPLLTIPKEAIYDYLKKEGLSWRIDSTNEQDSYLRNALRLHVIPALKQCDDRFEKKFETTIRHIQETELFLERVAQAAFERISLKTDNQLFIHRARFLEEDPFLHHRLILLWLCAEKVRFTPSTAFFNEIIRFFHSSGKAHQLTSSWRIEKNGDYLTLTKKS